MMVFRRARMNDLDTIYQLALNSGIGMTTLPKDITLLKNRVQWSCDSFEKTLSAPENEYYLFVLEDSDNGRIVGTSAVESAIGYDTPFYSYKISQKTRISHELNIRSDYEVLSLVNDNQGRSEICTLYLDPSYRKDANGLLLSRARFLFMGEHPERFSKVIIAEMRGVSDKDGSSPFWNHVMQKFFQLPFPEADKLTLSTNKQYIADLMPRNPLYIPLLHPDAQAVIGKPHQSTAPALHILEKEGFYFNQCVDIFDGGPTIEAELTRIKTITHTKKYRIISLSDEVSSAPYLLSNTHIHYRATLANIIFNDTQETCIISADTAEALQLGIGDIICFSPLKREENL